MKNTIEKPTSNDELNETPCAADSAVHGGDITQWTEAELVAENARRNAALVHDYDPMTGRGCCGDRVARKVGSVDYMLPRTMIDGAPKSVYRNKLKFQKARFEHDFEFWAATCVKIIDKTTHRQVPFVLNRAQRKLLGVLEGQRGRAAYTRDFAESKAVGRKHAGADIHGMDTTGAERELEQPDLRTSARYCLSNQGNV